jgi:aryl-alcohol dehydrogenase-like predicted oxidoreductase
VGIVPYSPLGRGELTGALEIGGEGDFRSNLPRFSGENRKRNLQRVERAKEIAQEVGCTPAQLALAWLLRQGDDVVPIPGTRHSHRLDENATAAEIELSDDQVARLEETFPVGGTAGTRYAEAGMRNVEL